MNELSLFTGAGGGLLGSILLGWKTIGAVEIEEYPCKVLEQRQRDGILSSFPIWNMDIREFNNYIAEFYRGKVDIITAGFPCQDISCANPKGRGIQGEKSGLWTEMVETIRIIMPHKVFVENSPILTVRGLDRVLWDLAEMGFDARWGVLGAIHAGAPHHRKRIWIVANSNSDRLAWISPQNDENEHKVESLLLQHWPPRPGAQSSIPRMVNGVAQTMDRLKAIGNGQVPRVAEIAWEMLSK